MSVHNATFTEPNVDHVPAAPAASPPKQYALVPRAEPIELPSTAAGCQSNKTDVREELRSIYESFAALYPNPDLSQENQERDRLLRAAQAADHAVRLNPVKKKKGGSWGGWFGGKKEEKEVASTQKVVYEDDDRLKYTETGEPSDWLLGTEFSLDPSNIPADAHAVARRHLASSSTSSSHPTPNVARTAWERAGTSCIVIVDLGTFVEFPLKSNGAANGQIQHTSDRQILLDFKNEQQAETYSVAQARAALIGPNLLVVSWGFRNDGFVVFYRRMTTEGDVVWDAVAVLGPTKEVQESLCDIFIEEGEGDSALLGVSDLGALDCRSAGSSSLCHFGGGSTGRILGTCAPPTPDVVWT